LSVVNSTVAANRALKHGGGIIVNDLGFDEAVVSLNAVTVARNVVDADGDGEGGGGGLFRESADSFEVENSLIGLNRLGSGRRNDCAGTLVFDSLGHNLVSTLRPFEAGDPTCSGFDRPTDIVGVGPRIGKPRRNGGPTKTIALRKGSPAIGKARRTTAPKRDQRGKRKDIGAYERNTRR
jgi:hypothetical protein